MCLVGSLTEIAEELLKAVERNRLTCEEMLAVESGSPLRPVVVQP
jgi:hypothetical protein